MIAADLPEARIPAVMDGDRVTACLLWSRPNGTICARVLVASGASYWRRRYDPVAQASPAHAVRVRVIAGTSRRMSMPARAPIAKAASARSCSSRRRSRGGCTNVAAADLWLARRLVGGTLRLPQGLNPFLAASGIPWTIVRATAFMETWGAIMGEPLRSSGKIAVFGKGDNPVNFVSATDVAALVSHAATSPGLHGQVLELGGPDNLTFNQVAAIVQQATGCRGALRHIPRPALRAMAWLTAATKPALARQARAALAMDTIDMTFDSTATRQALPDLPNTDMPSALKELLG